MYSLHALSFGEAFVCMHLCCTVSQDVHTGNRRFVVLSPFSTLLFRCRQRKSMTAKLYFCVPSPLKKLVLALQSLKMSCFYFTFCSWSYKTTNEVSGWRNFSPATAKYVCGKRALVLFFNFLSGNNENNQIQLLKVCFSKLLIFRLLFYSNEVNYCSFVSN